MGGSDQKALASGGMFLGVGAAFLLGSLQYPIGNFWRMGAGFFPLAVSIALMIVGVAVIGTALTASSAPSRMEWRLRNLVVITSAVTAFALLVQHGGMLLATAALVGISTFAAKDLKLSDVAISFCVLCLVAWLVFIRLLGLQLTMLPRAFGS